VEFAYDPIEMADSHGIESGGKLRPLNGVNWQRREKVLRAGRGGALCHVQMTHCVTHFFNVGSPELRSLLTIIFHSTTNFAQDNEFPMGFYHFHEMILVGNLGFRIFLSFVPGRF
jgi:hypothetical protein